MSRSFLLILEGGNFSIFLFLRAPSFLEDMAKNNYMFSCAKKYGKIAKPHL